MSELEIFSLVEHGFLKFSVAHNFSLQKESNPELKTAKYELSKGSNQRLKVQFELIDQGLLMTSWNQNSKPGNQAVN